MTRAKQGSVPPGAGTHTDDHGDRRVTAVRARTRPTVRLVGGGAQVTRRSSGEDPIPALTETHNG